MTVDHLPASGIELEDLVEHTESSADADDVATGEHGGKPSEPASESPENDEGWPQTGFGSFP